MIQQINQPEFDVRLRTMQVIALAITGGAAAFLVLTLVVPLQRGLQPGQTPLLTYVVLGIGILLTPLARIVPEVVVAAGLKAIAPTVATAEPAATADRLLQLFQTRLIVGLAFVEGAAFMAIIAYWLEGQTVALLAAALFLVFLALQFPTRAGLERWLEAQIDRLRQGEIS